MDQSEGWARHHAMTDDPLDTLPPAHAANDNGALRVVMERLGGMSAALVELKALVQAMAARQQQEALERLAASATQEAKITAAHTRLDGHEGRLKELEDFKQDAERKLGRFEVVVSIAVFLGSTLGAAVVLLIWGLITGTVKVLPGS